MQDSKNTPRLSHKIFLLLWPHKHAKSLAHLCVWFLKTGELSFIRVPYANNHVTQNKFLFKGFPNRQSDIMISCKNIASLYRHISRNQSIKWHHVCTWTPRLSVFCRQETQCWQQRWAQFFPHSAGIHDFSLPSRHQMTLLKISDEIMRNDAALQVLTLECVFPLIKSLLKWWDSETLHRNNDGTCGQSGSL